MKNIDIEKVKEEFYKRNDLLPSICEQDGIENIIYDVYRNITEEIFEILEIIKEQEK